MAGSLHAKHATEHADMLLSELAMHVYGCRVNERTCMCFLFPLSPGPRIAHRSDLC